MESLKKDGTHRASVHRLSRAVQRILARHQPMLAGITLNDTSSGVHRYTFHEDIVRTKVGGIAGTWLSPHFRIENLYAICKHCGYNINIFQGVYVLRDHLAEFHNINKYTRCKERTGFNNANGITQKSVDEGNSESHDDILRKSLENQKGQQSLMLQQSTAEENYAGLSFDHISGQSFRNQEDQHSLMLQQSVANEIYADPSFDHNNSFRQSFENQEG